MAWARMRGSHEARVRTLILCLCRYGAAGAEIIQRNLGLSGGSTIETFSAGRNVDAVFTFCDIRKFTNTTEVPSVIDLDLGERAVPQLPILPRCVDGDRCCRKTCYGS